VRRGASWTAAYRRQLTVAAVARPVRDGVGALGVLAAERSWLVLAQTASAQRSVQPVSRGRASSPWSTRPAGTPRRRSPVSSRRCPPIRVRRPGSGCPAVRCPVTWGWSSRGSGGRTAAVQLSVVQPSAVRCPSVRCPGVWCLPSSVRTRPSPPPQAVALGTRSRWPGDPGHRDGWRPCGCRAVDGSIDGRGGRDAGDAAEVALVKGAGGGPGLPVGCGPRRPRLPAERPGRPGRRAERPVAGGCAVGTRGRLQREVAAAAAWLPPSGWGRDHGGWSWPSLTPGWAAPKGPLEVPAGMGVRPQRGPSRQRARPARCRQRSDLRRWVVGLPGLEPGTSSLSAIQGSAPCGPLFPQLAADRRA
jgi:hypothetical protein